MFCFMQFQVHSASCTVIAAQHLVRAPGCLSVGLSCLAEHFATIMDDVWLVLATREFRAAGGGGRPRRCIKSAGQVARRQRFRPRARASLCSWLVPRLNRCPLSQEAQPAARAGMSGAAPRRSPADEGGIRGRDYSTPGIVQGDMRSGSRDGLPSSGSPAWMEPIRGSAGMSGVGCRVAPPPPSAGGWQGPSQGSAGMSGVCPGAAPSDPQHPGSMPTPSKSVHQSWGQPHRPPREPPEGTTAPIGPSTWEHSWRSFGGRGARAPGCSSPRDSAPGLGRGWLHGCLRSERGHPPLLCDLLRLIWFSHQRLAWESLSGLMWAVM